MLSFAFRVLDIIINTVIIKITIFAQYTYIHVKGVLWLFWVAVNFRRRAVNCSSYFIDFQLFYSWCPPLYIRLRVAIWQVDVDKSPVEFDAMREKLPLDSMAVSCVPSEIDSNHFRRLCYAEMFAGLASIVSQRPLRNPATLRSWHVVANRQPGRPAAKQGNRTRDFNERYDIKLHVLNANRITVRYFIRRLYSDFVLVHWHFASHLQKDSSIVCGK